MSRRVHTLVSGTLALALFFQAATAGAVFRPGFGFQTGESPFRQESRSLFDPDGHGALYNSGLGLTGGVWSHVVAGCPYRITNPLHVCSTVCETMSRRVAAESPTYQLKETTFAASYPYEALPAEDEPASRERIYFKGWLLITSVEMILLTVTALMPKEWTGWSSTFVQDGLGNFQDAYTHPPVWDTDHWFHNYIGHPYGGNVYYNTVRSQGAPRGKSFLFTFALSMQWEYIFEAVAEQPSIQDIFITPIAGAILGEGVHHLTAKLKENGTSFPEKVVITILNPTSVFFNGYN